ncbi:hypothetical protein STSP2_00206 [Anaerohalosphaera lusitana]|uniref:Lipocalin-like domain-containing protein n=1 Tax=Anaerohalosphaera lusitana TaxID=1936003 RepID=A0A1U9NHS8_9BACT|nr:hypothetical protein [Anaerohalosphaera lusitana]AQT67066.1 hypothetical protein STSP2_00206 [Anaerohalosphaera lusitana]
MLRLSIIVLFCTVISGCASHSMNVILPEGAVFPEQMVGTWSNIDTGWEITFENDGEIPSAVLALGRFEIEPGQTKTYEMKKGKSSRLEAGEWTVQYDSDSEEVTVEIVIEDLHVEIGGGYLEGHLTEILAGVVSEDGQRWNVDWITMPQYVAYTTGNEEGMPLQEPGETQVKQLVFKKAADDGEDQ